MTGKPRPEAEILAVGRGACELLHYLHNESQHPQLGRVVHGFLVPGHTHRMGDGTVKVAGLDVQVLIRAGHAVLEWHLSYRAPEFRTI